MYSHMHASTKIATGLADQSILCGLTVAWHPVFFPFRFFLFSIYACMHTHTHTHMHTFINDYIVVVVVFRKC